MHETLCFSIQSPSPNLDDLPLRCDGCETVSCMVGSCSDHARIMVGSVPHCNWVFTCVSCICGRQNSVTLGSFPHCKWDCKWCWWRSCRWSFEGSLARNAFLRDSRCTKPYMFFHTKSVPEPRWSTSAVRRLRDGLVCGRIMFGSCSDQARIMVGSVPHCKWGFTCVSCICGRQNSIVICNCRVVPAM